MMNEALFIHCTRWGRISKKLLSALGALEARWLGAFAKSTTFVRVRCALVLALLAGRPVGSMSMVTSMYGCHRTMKWHPCATRRVGSRNIGLYWLASWDVHSLLTKPCIISMGIKRIIGQRIFSFARASMETV